MRKRNGPPEERPRAWGEHRDTGGTWGTGINRRHQGPDRRAVIGSLVFHVVLFGTLAASSVIYTRKLPEFEVYRVKLYSPPPQVAAAPEPVVTPPPPVVRRPEPQRTVQPQPRPPARQPPRPVEQKPPPREQPKPTPPEPTRGANARPDSPGGENLDLNLEGKDFPFPDYLENIVLQLHRYFRWSGNPNLQGEVAFYIDRQGAAGGTRVIAKSGDFNFDLEMMSAIEQAGRRGAFGPLPDGWVSDRLWVRFKFLPPG